MVLSHGDKSSISDKPVAMTQEVPQQHLDETCLQLQQERQSTQRLHSQLCRLGGYHRAWFRCSYSLPWPNFTSLTLGSSPEKKPTPCSEAELKTFEFLTYTSRLLSSQPWKRWSCLKCLTFKLPVFCKTTLLFYVLYLWVVTHAGQFEVQLDGLFFSSCCVEIFLSF